MDLHEFQRKYRFTLDAQQQAAVQAEDGQTLVAAVPGSGKTTVLVARLGYLLHVRGISPEQILTMTYTVAAARDMRERYASYFGEAEANRLEFRTINGVCSRLITLYERATGRTAFRLLEDGREKSALLGELFYEKHREFASDSTLKNLETAITFVKNEMLKEDALEEVKVEGADFPAFYRAYTKTLLERRLMDYDDQMVYALRILRQYPEILRAVQTKFRFFCVDEMQDTSKIQHMILRLLVGEHGNLFAVGDEDQSIYGFRAACPMVLTKFNLFYPNAQILRMEQNYRSAGNIVTAADRFIQKNVNRIPKHMRATRPEGLEIREIQVYDRQKQYSYLCQLAAKCTQETAILYRENDSALPLIDCLHRASIPYRCRQVDSFFFTNRVVRDIADIIRFARNPYDGALFQNIYYKLGAGISKAAAQEAVEQVDAAERTILERVADNPTVSPWTKKQCRMLQTHLTNLLQERADRAIYRIVHFMGYGAYLEDRGGDFGKTDILQALGAREDTPERLLERLEELREVVRAGGAGENGGVVLSTIHSSKGLEYDRVILMDVADGLLPKILPDRNAPDEVWEAYEEERRLFYVGMTRARESLQIVTFRKAGLESTFAREILPVRAQASGRSGVPERHSRAALPDKAPLMALSLEPYRVGTRIRHGTFGAGIIQERTGELAAIAFDRGVTKKISLSVALRAGKLETEQKQ